MADGSTLPNRTANLASALVGAGSGSSDFSKASRHSGELEVNRCLKPTINYRGKFPTKISGAKVPAP